MVGLFRRTARTGAQRFLALLGVRQAGLGPTHVRLRSRRRDRRFQDRIHRRRNPDLSAFQKAKGKLLIYHGWADPVVPPEDGIRYYETVGARWEGRRESLPSSACLWCRGWATAATVRVQIRFDTLGGLDQRVTEGAAPQKIIASHTTNGAVDRTRLLCPYPQVSKWNGSGSTSTDDEASFTCAAEDRR
jgi:feruloyl esterase